MCLQKVSVKMGSRQYKIEVSTGNTKCSDLIESVLQKSKIDRKLASTYTVYESVSGIERQMQSSENVIKSPQSKSSIEFTVRKCMAVKKAVPSSDQQAKIKKYYEKLNQKSTSSLKVSDVPFSAEKDNYMEIILKNEVELEKQAKKLQEFGSTSSLCNKHCNQLESNLANSKLVDNINFLQFLYYKLKNQNEETSRLIDNNSCGNSVADDAEFEYSSSCYSSSSSLRYESLV